LKSTGAKKEGKHKKNVCPREEVAGSIKVEGKGGGGPSWGVELQVYWVAGRRVQKGQGKHWGGKNATS